MAMRLILLLVVTIIWGATTIVVPSAAAAQIALPNCPEHCGSLTIPYPFGVSKNCCMGSDYFINCTADGVAYLFENSSIPVTNISVDVGEVQIQQLLAYDCSVDKDVWTGLDIGLSPPYTISGAKNKFMAVGCDTVAQVEGFAWNSQYFISGCMSQCPAIDSVDDNSCSGIGCCQTSISDGLTNSTVWWKSLQDPTSSLSFNSCNYAFIVQEGQFNFSGNASTQHLRDTTMLPMILNWGIGEESCEVAAQNKSQSLPCKGNSKCVNRAIGRAAPTSYICQCLPGYDGNPYHPNGCQDICFCDEYNGYISLQMCLLNPCIGPCINTPGNYTCVCPKGTEGDGRKSGTGCYRLYRLKRSSDLRILSLSLGTSGALLSLIIGAWWVYKVMKKRRDIRRKKMFFQQNGGLLLEKQLKSGEVNVEKIKLFEAKELEKSTDNFNEDRILGQGSQGCVYKGMLSFGRIVAVKKSKIVDESKISEFINEVVILSQINHRNVVQLLGCCLETKVPLLVYEFISNGTLSEHIHEDNEDFPLTFELRLRIATEIAGALSYLHSAASVPIYHRDIKSTNILLDKKYRAKVADFGTSRSIAVDQTHLTTNVHGTFGYLDPEYFQSNQFTDKSDVYSFGVVLVELLTGKKPISVAKKSREQEKIEYRSLASYFIISMHEERLFDILDTRVLKEGSDTEIRVLANLARRCLNLNGRNRPTMREVTAELEGIRSSTERTSNPQHTYKHSEIPRNDTIEQWDPISSSTVTLLASDCAPTEGASKKKVAEECGLMKIVQVPSDVGISDCPRSPEDTDYLLVDVKGEGVSGSFVHSAEYYNSIQTHEIQMVNPYGSGR